MRPAPALLAVAALGLSLLGAAPRRTLLPDDDDEAGDGARAGPDAAEPGPDAEEEKPGPDAALRDASAAEVCEGLQARIERRKAWLADRRQEQFERGPVDRKRGVPDVVRLFCEAHPSDEECLLGNAVIEASVEELVWVPDAGVDEYEPHLVALRRELAECRSRLKGRRR